MNNSIHENKDNDKADKLSSIHKFFRSPYLEIGY